MTYRREIPKSEALTVAAARTQLKLLLGQAVSLDHLTAEGLHRSYRVPLREIEYMLTIARQKREAQG